MGLVLPQTVKVKWSSRIKQYYIERGYVFTKMNDEFEVDVRDLTHGSHAKVKCQCDICGNEKMVVYKNYIRHIFKDNKYYCEKCVQIKRKQTVSEKYGSEYITQTELFKTKARKTMKQKYGVENYAQTKEYREKAKQTWLKTLGVEHPSKSAKVKKKVLETNFKRYGACHAMKLKRIQIKAQKTNVIRYGTKCPLQNQIVYNKARETIKKEYGVENVSQAEIIKEQKKKTCLKNYGVEHPAQNEKIREKIKQTWLKTLGVEHPLQSKKIQKKVFNTMVKNYGSKYGNFFIRGSKAQKHIHKLVGGKYNYYFHGFFPDIAFVEDKIVVEYDGTGHDECVKRGKMTNEKFIQRELEKENKLFEEGWKIIRLVNEKTDKLPDDETIVNLINEKIHILKTTDTKKVVVKWS